MQLHSRRRHAMPRCRLLVAVLVLSLAAALLFFARVPYGLVAGTPGRVGLLLPPRRLPLGLAAVRGITPAASGARREDDWLEEESVLLPDWEVLVLLRHDAPAENATCVFGGGGAASSTSPARALGRLPASASSSGRRHAYVCVIPKPARRRQPFHAPRLVSPSSSTTVVPDAAARGAGGSGPGRAPPEMLRWSGRLVYDSVVDGGDVLVFAKGVNPRQGVNRAAADVRCVYYRGAAAAAADDVVASLPAATSAQQVFRCPPPPPTPALQPSSQELRVTLAVTGEKTIPSLALYTPTRSSAATTPTAGKKKLICACTMVRDVAKFLREWVVYHAAVGVDRFFIYDNGSEDDLADQVRQLSLAGYDVSTVVWPWTKTQEAGFSHSAAVQRDSCEWMAFVDVDEFIFSPRWVKSNKPTRSMLQSLVSSVKPDVGQVSLGCVDFGPSGRTTHPEEGVTQGYTCRRRTKERHKSLLRLGAVDQSLLNSIHHFTLRPGFRGERSRQIRVNHYKYQAWKEFKVKFRRRVSTYVVDWTDPVNPQSKDRMAGLGFKAVEPVGWTRKFCEVNDTLLRDTTRRWFGVGFRNKLSRRQIGTGVQTF